MSKDKQIALTVIPEPAPNTRSLLVPQGKFPVIRGEGDMDLVCGKCGQVLVESVGKGVWLKNLVIRCPNCKSYNEVP